MGKGSVSVWAEPGMVIAMSGMTIAGELFEAAPTLAPASGAAEAGSMMPPLINATAGSAEQILRNGNLMVCTWPILGMTLLRQTLGFDR
jgi:hypothetical protein